jgi:hypothetical protein
MTPLAEIVYVGGALSDEMARQGVTMGIRDGVMYVSDAALFAAIFASFDQADGEKPAKIAEIKAEAQRRIFLIAPQWKQANLTARAAEMALGGGPQDPSEAAEVAAGTAIWNRIKALRAASDEIETRLAGLTDVVDVVAFDVVDAPEWPE